MNIKRENTGPNNLARRRAPRKVIKTGTTTLPWV